MKVSYDTQAVALYIKFQDGKFVKNKEIQEGVILDIGEGEALLGIEVLNATSRFSLQDLSQVDVRMPLELAETTGLEGVVSSGSFTDALRHGSEYPFSLHTVATVPRSKGVYAIFEDYRCIYIGKSNNLRSRLKMHLEGPKPEEGDPKRPGSQFRYYVGKFRHIVADPKPAYRLEHIEHKFLDTCKTSAS